jgi:hypothetical protein
MLVPLDTLNYALLATKDAEHLSPNLGKSSRSNKTQKKTLT